MDRVAESCRDIEMFSKLAYGHQSQAGSLEPAILIIQAMPTTTPSIQSMISQDAAQTAYTIRTLGHLLSTVQGECAEAWNWMREFYVDREKARGEAGSSSID
jgi:hypothetical protein